MRHDARHHSSGSGGFRFFCLGAARFYLRLDLFYFAVMLLGCNFGFLVHLLFLLFLLNIIQRKFSSRLAARMKETAFLTDIPIPNDPFGQRNV